MTITDNEKSNNHKNQDKQFEKSDGNVDLKFEDNNSKSLLNQEFDESAKSFQKSDGAIIDDATSTENPILPDQNDFEAFEKTISLGFKNILNAFNQKIAYDKTKQHQIDALHNELQQYRTDLIAKTNRPIVNGVIKLHDDIGRLIEKIESDPDQFSTNRFIKMIGGIQEDLEILLDQNGIMAFRESGDKFAPRRQQVIRKLNTADKSLNGLIANTLRPGFEQGDELIKKERVSIYVFSETSDEQDSLRTPEDEIKQASTEEYNHNQRKEKNDV